jgi:hypothetical protein
VYLVENCQRRWAKVRAKRVSKYQKTPAVFEGLIAEGCVVMLEKFEVGEHLSICQHVSAMCNFDVARRWPLCLPHRVPGKPSSPCRQRQTGEGYQPSP